jgi:Mrp family chromosome partitioning ATPase
LALAFAEQQAGEVLLIEATRRHPMLGTRLGFAAPLCFGLQMEAALNHPSYCYKAVAALVDNLHVLAFNPKEGVGPGLLSAAAFEYTMRLLERLPHTRIIVDCPNVLGSADINLIQDNVQQLLMSVRAGSTSRADLKSAIANLAPTPISGTVLFGG